MNPLSIRAENYRSFSELDLRLPEGPVAIVGDNGAGKSSLVNVIDICLFGARSLADFHADDATGDLLLELVFEHGGKTYRVRRGYSAKGRGKTTLDFEQRPSPDTVTEAYAAVEWYGGAWEPLTQESQKETQALIAKTLGLSRATFRASTFLAQGDGAAFTEAQPGDRKRVLAEVLGLDVWARLLERVRADKNESQNRETGLTIQIDAASNEIAACFNLAAHLAEAEAEVAKWSASYEEAAAAWEALRSQIDHDVVMVERVARLRGVRDVAQSEVDRLEEQGRKALAERDYLEAMEKEIEDLPKPDEIGKLLRLETLYREVEANRVERERLVAMRESLREESIDVQAHICPTCKQHVAGDARTHAQQSLAQRNAELVAALDALNNADHDDEILEIIAALDPENERSWDADYVREQLDYARRGDNRRAAYEERLKLAPAPVDRVELKQAQEQARLAAVDYDKASAGVRSEQSLEEMRAQLLERERMIEEARSMGDQARDSRSRISEKVERIEAVKVLREKAKQERSTIQADLELLALLERAFGPDGIPAMIVEQAAIPQIESEATRILSEMGSGMRVELHSQRQLKSSDGLADTLDVVVVSDNGAVRPYETFSGGERTRINLALRIALARLLSHRRGADSRCLVVDEPEFLDEPGTEALAGILQGMHEDFDRIYLVSHVAALRDTFEQTIDVRKVNGRSEVVGQADTEGSAKPPEGERLSVV